MTRRSGEPVSRLWPTPAGISTASPALRMDGGATLPAEAHLRLAGGDAEHLVGGRMVVVEGEDAVPPAIAPAIAVEQILEGARRGSPAATSMAPAFEGLFHRNGWGSGWRNGIFPFHHYHSTAHEVLGIAEGSAEVRFGGEAGKALIVNAGDAVLIPAGVGHKRLSGSPDLLVIGAYPGGQWADLMREGAGDKSGIRARIAEVPVPKETRWPA